MNVLLMIKGRGECMILLLMECSIIYLDGDELKPKAEKLKPTFEKLEAAFQHFFIFLQAASEQINSAQNAAGTLPHTPARSRYSPHIHEKFHSRVGDTKVVEIH